MQYSTVKQFSPSGLVSSSSLRALVPSCLRGHVRPLGPLGSLAWRWPGLRLTPRGSMAAPPAMPPSAIR